jgi:hypothetical protein
VGFVVDKVALGQGFSEYFGFPCQSSFHQILHHHNHPGQVQYAIQRPTCRLDPAWTPPPHYVNLKKKINFPQLQQILTPDDGHIGRNMSCILIFNF